MYYFINGLYFQSAQFFLSSFKYRHCNLIDLLMLLTLRVFKYALKWFPKFLAFNFSPPAESQQENSSRVVRDLERA